MAETVDELTDPTRQAPQGACVWNLDGELSRERCIRNVTWKSDRELQTRDLGPRAADRGDAERRQSNNSCLVKQGPRRSRLNRSLNHGNKFSVKEGDVVRLTAPTGGIKSGDGFMSGALFAVAHFDAPEATPVEGGIVGVWVLPEGLHPARPLPKALRFFGDSATGDL